jgi:hypothetical protein
MLVGKLSKTLTNDWIKNAERFEARGGMATISGFAIETGISILGGFCDTASVDGLGLFT